MSVDSYYTLGRSGLRVSRLALGTMTFGTKWGWGSDENTSRTIFDRYVAAGGNFIDTADIYTGGTSEQWVGKFMREAGLRDRMVIATKFSQNLQPGNPNSGGNHRKNILRAVEASLKRLGTDYIDLYFLHTWDQVTPVDEVMRTLDDLVRAGKIRYVGLSDVPSWYASRAQTLAELRGWAPAISMQLEYSLAERNIEFEYSALGQQLGMGIMVWSPLASGLLSGKYTSDGKGDGRLAKISDRGSSVFQKFGERSARIITTLDEAARTLGRSHAQIALNWVANRPAVGAVILGGTRIEQVEENLQSLDFELPAEWRDRLDAVSAPDLRFPYTFFAQQVQSGIHGGVEVGDKPTGYRRPIRIARNPT